MKLLINQIVCGDARRLLKELPEESINCSISSPPYWGLRDYGLPPLVWGGEENCEHKWNKNAGPRRNRKEADVADMQSKQATVGGSNYDAQASQFCSLCGAWRGSLGLEPTIELYIDHLCGIYDEVFRVLRKDGTCWVNLGDTYAGGKGQSGSGNPEEQAERFATGVSLNKSYHQIAGDGLTRPNDGKIGIPAKSLCLIPFRFAIEMVKRGWILRNTINWHKPNPMPSSAKDRFTVDFEYVFFFVKNDKVLWHYRPDGAVSDKQPDFKSGVEGLDWQWDVRKGKKVKLSLWQGFRYFFEPQYEPNLTESNVERPRMGQGKNTIYKQKRNDYKKHTLRSVHAGNTDIDYRNPLGRNKRTTWTMPTEAFPEAHFATFPQALVEPMILAGCPEFVCKKCGKARVKIYSEATGGAIGKAWLDHSKDSTQGNLKTVPSKGYEKGTFKGYTDCGCKAGFRPGVCLDMFSGAGTVGLVAYDNRRDYILFDQSEEYCKMAERRIDARRQQFGLIEIGKPESK